VLFVASVAQPGKGTYNLTACTLTTPDGTWDLSALRIPTGYHWSQPVYPQGMTPMTGDNTNLIDGHANPPQDMSWEFQICGAVKSRNGKCDPNSAVNIIYPSGNCSSGGDSRVATLATTPYRDGVQISYYSGDYLDHINAYETTIFITCNKNAQAPFVEHLKAYTYQWHIRLETPVVCK